MQSHGPGELPLRSAGCSGQPNGFHSAVRSDTSSALHVKAKAKKVEAEAAREWPPKGEGPLKVRL